MDAFSVEYLLKLVIVSSGDLDHLRVRVDHTAHVVDIALDLRPDVLQQLAELRQFQKMLVISRCSQILICRTCVVIAHTVVEIPERAHVNHALIEIHPARAVEAGVRIHHEIFHDVPSCERIEVHNG